MKNAILICLTIISLSLNSYGQTKFGLKGGFNYTNIGYNSGVDLLDQTFEETTAAKFGYHAGVFVHFSLTEKLAFQPELLFSTQGQKNNNSFPSTFNLNYLSLPLLLEIKLAKRIGLSAGPHVNYLLVAKNKFEGNSTDARIIYDNDWDIGWTGGLFVDLSTRLQLTARYQQGLSTLSKELTFTDEFGMPITDDVKNRNQVVQVGINVFLNKS